MKTEVSDLVLFSNNRPLFQPPISTSNLVKPDEERFFEYSKIFFDAHQYTNNGPAVRMLEARLSKFHETEFCVAFANGFWGIVLAIKALARPGKSEIIIPSMTYRRLADIAAWTQLKPRFAEIDPHTLAMGVDEAKACITDETALILAAHPIVNCCDAGGLSALAESAGLPILFDSVESVYETVAGRKVGSFGNAECFSLHASKLINGFEGGYVTTNDELLAKRLSIMRGFGFLGPDDVQEFGINAKLNEIHAAMALACLDDLEDQVERNRQRYYLYRNVLSEFGLLRLLPFDESEKTSYKNILVELLEDWPLSRENTLRILNSEGALARPYYSPPLHKRNMKYPFIPATLPITDALAEKFILLPCGHMVSDDDISSFVQLLAFLRDNAMEINRRLES